MASTLCALFGQVNSVERFDDSRSAWGWVSPMALPRMGCGVAAAEGILYVVGGRSSGNVLDSIERYDSHKETWQLLARMPVGRSACGLAITQ